MPWPNDIKAHIIKAFKKKSISILLFFPHYLFPTFCSTFPQFFPTGNIQNLPIGGPMLQCVTSIQIFALLNALHFLY